MADPPLPGTSLAARFKDPGQPAVTESAQLPDRLIQACVNSLSRLRLDEQLAQRFLGCWLTEPHSLAVFEPPMDGTELAVSSTLYLDRRTRMLYRGQSLFINGELAPIKPTAWLKQLANERQLHLTAKILQTLSDTTRDYLLDWIDAGWVHIEWSQGDRS